ncbi:hypothetical protein FEDK69T_02330 [Flavobacterium enshiense DK69]|uniref:Outer membrane protein beta-barrel domain-containing protein n=1 Tax=Flavobacterium enshiense DK69 TaxID=1107311 RepID=V6SEB7_9FLAO|nr:hypothetical protein [Flavobacterium enshiense]ESU25043.1 hypothetical protein FEDK69T_02330 [Flavobacterium enshiense DK69]KGO96853.1 hypothetical protein Q767_03910 [Flavobacterium enshiense DK69]
MKTRSILITGLLLVSSLFVQAQTSGGGAPKSSGGIRLNAYGSYAFDDSFDSYYDYGYYFNGKIKGGFMYGVGVEYEAAPSTFIELYWQSLNTTAPTHYYNGGIFGEEHTDLDVAINYIMLGGNRSFRKPGSMVEGFGGLSAGVGIVNLDNPKNGRSDSTTKFAWGMKGGAIIWPSEKVGIRLQAQLLSISQAFGGGVYVGTGGPGVGVSSYSTVYQFTLGGGLVFNVGG